MTDIISGNIYDYPRYYDLVFGSDWQAEYKFLNACFAKYLKSQDHLRLFEPACGTGRLLYRLAQAGHEVSGLDLNERAVAFCNQRLEKHGFPPSAYVADMSDFTVKKKVNAAFNTINSFRHLLTQRAAVKHMRCVAAALKKGGIYILGLHLTPTAGEITNHEDWSAGRGHLRVNTSMTTTSRDLATREERCAMVFDIYTPTRHQRLEDEIIFRIYTQRQLQHLLRSVPELALVGVHDFTYDIDAETTIDEHTEDVVLVLRKR
jgi:SAM-dependent methyltransferase